MGEFKSAITMKCPRCGQGDLYKNTGIIPKKGMFDMIEKCDHCGLKYEKEMGFFYGAMYISYALNMALFITATVAYYLFFENAVDWRVYIMSYLLLTLILTKWIYRMSRSLWLMIMISYQPDKKD